VFYKQQKCVIAKGIEAITPQAANTCAYSEANKTVWRPRSKSEKPDPVPTFFSRNGDSPKKNIFIRLFKKKILVLPPFVFACTLYQAVRSTPQPPHSVVSFAILSLLGWLYGVLASILQLFGLGTTIGQASKLCTIVSINLLVLLAFMALFSITACNQFYKKTIL
jgi:hypothetical protein